MAPTPEAGNSIRAQLHASVDASLLEIGSGCPTLESHGHELIQQQVGLVEDARAQIGAARHLDAEAPHEEIRPDEEPGCFLSSKTIRSTGTETVEKLHATVTLSDFRGGSARLIQGEARKLRLARGGD